MPFPVGSVVVSLDHKICDAVYTGNTPREQQRGRKSKKSTHHIASRVIGVEVHCGPIHGTLLYYTDDLSRGGSSTIIEVTRQGIVQFIILCLLLFFVVSTNNTLLAYHSLYLCSTHGLATTSASNSRSLGQFIGFTPPSYLAI
jgi:hypothetical protein